MTDHREIIREMRKAAEDDNAWYLDILADNLVAMLQTVASEPFALALVRDATAEIAKFPAVVPLADRPGYAGPVHVVDAADAVLHLSEHRVPDGYSWSSSYLLDAWLPVTGATAVCLAQVVHDCVAEQTIGVDVLAARLGLSSSKGRRSKVLDSLDRVARFRLAKWNPTTHELSIPESIPPISAASRQRLSQRLGAGYLLRLDDKHAMFSRTDRPPQS